MGHYGRVLLRVSTLVCVALIVAGCVFVYLHPPTSDSSYPRCLFYSATGLFCPGCGGTRCLYYLMHGDIANAASSNLLALLFLPFGAVLMVKAVKFSLFGSWARIPQLNRFVLALAVSVIVFGIVRNLPGFSFLTPSLLPPAGPK